MAEPRPTSQSKPTPRDLPITVVICPECLTAQRRSQFETAPDREGKRCWRCPGGRYVRVEVPTR